MQDSKYKLITSTNVIQIHDLDDHPYRGWLSPDGKMFYLRIPKNASSFMSGELEGMGWIDVGKAEHLRYDAGICLLRDPYHRWISGIVQFFHDVGIIMDDLMRSWSLIRKMLINQPNQDAHTTPQISYLHGHDLERFSFVLMSNHQVSAGERMHTLLNTKGYHNEMNRHAFQNTTADDVDRASMKNALLSNIKDDAALISRIKSYYKDDYALLEWVGNTKGWA